MLGAVVDRILPDRGQLAMSSASAGCSCPSDRVAHNVVAAAAQLVDHLLTTVDRIDMHLTEVASGVVETDPVHVSEPARC
jgi:hypothetical protein